MDSAQWPQVVVKSMEEEEEGGIRRAVGERKAAKPGKDQILNCPRCNSNNTKFCYYNNYSLSQPRYFCKSCRRYWTAGGSLRNIPVGGASRKNKRPSANFSSPADPNSNNISSPKNNNNNNDIGDDDRDHDNDQISNPIMIINGTSKLSNMIINTSSSSSSSNSNSNSNATTSCCWLSSDHMNQMLRSNNGMSQRELIPFMPMPAAAPQPTSMCTTAADHCNPSRNMNNNGLFEGEGGEAARRLFSSTVEDFKQLPTIISADQNGEKLGDVPAFWNGIFGGGSW